MTGIMEWWSKEVMGSKAHSSNSAPAILDAPTPMVVDLPYKLE